MQSALAMSQHVGGNGVVVGDGCLLGSSMRSSALTSKHHHLYRAGGRGPDVLVAILAQAPREFSPDPPAAENSPHAHTWH